jgi:hypothetical protein
MPEASWARGGGAGGALVASGGADEATGGADEAAGGGSTAVGLRETGRVRSSRSAMVTSALWLW